MGGVNYTLWCVKSSQMCVILAKKEEIALKMVMHALEGI